MQLGDVFAPGLTTDEVFLKRLPRLHRARLSQFRQFVAAPLIFCFRFTDTDRCYTIKLDGNAALAEDGEMIDFPLATIEGKESDWERFKARFLELAEEADRRADDYVERVSITSSMVKAFERFDGTIKVKLTGGGLDKPIALRVVLNDYEAAEGGRVFSVELPVEVAFSVVRGELAPSAAAKELKVQGDMGFAMDLGGYFLKHIQG